MCYWFAVSSRLRRYILASSRASSAATILFAVGIGCVANWFRSRTLDCVLAGPLFFIACVLLLLSDLHMAHVNSRHRLVCRSHWNRHRVSAGMAVCGSVLLRLESAGSLESSQRRAE